LSANRDPAAKSQSQKAAISSIVVTELPELPGMVPR
jgi:hypothetical protein